jgi:membrane protein DedA with SNARE-associated domain
VFPHLSELISTHGYWVVAVVVGIESIGVPVPGETMLVTAAIYAGTTHRLNIALVITAAALGGVVGHNLGFLVGRRYGYHLLLRYRSLLRLNDSRIKLGQLLFDRHGGKVVFFGRFIALLRTLAAVLAGTNQMPWWRFLFFNALGAVVWSTVYGMAAYAFGEELERLSTFIGVVLLVAAGAAISGSIWFVRRHEAALQAEAERAFPGPLRLDRRR